MKLCIIMLSSVLIVSCTKEDSRLIHKKKDESKVLKNSKVVNEKDPVCNMEISKFLKDTVVYKGKVYVFCSKNCKKEFKKLNEKYSHK